MEITIHPHQGINDAKLDMTKDEIRRSIGGEFREYKKGNTEADQFMGKTIHAYYDPNGRCKAFEIYAPTKVFLLGVQVTGKPFGEILRWLSAITSDTETNSSGVRSLEFGVSMFAPYASSDPEEPIQSALVFRRGYWNKKNETPIEGPRMKP